MYNGQNEDNKTASNCVGEHIPRSSYNLNCAVKKFQLMDQKTTVSSEIGPALSSFMLPWSWIDCLRPLFQKRRRKQTMQRSLDATKSKSMLQRDDHKSLEVESETSKLMKSPVIWVEARKESSVPKSKHGRGIMRPCARRSAPIQYNCRRCRRFQLSTFSRENLRYSMDAFLSPANFNGLDF